jgi:electron transfer flavoprotein beta subunit
VDALVCVKAIANEPPRLREDGGEPGFERGRSARLILNESDAYAIDGAVQLKKRHGGRVAVVTIGPLASQDALYTALAKGADEAVRVDADGSDPLQVARLLAAVVEQGSYDLVLTGIESHEELASAAGPALAAYLDRPFASAVTAIEANGDRVAVTREMGGGFFQTLEMPLPAVLSVQSGICRLSYPPTVRVLQARRQRIRSLTARDLGVDVEPPASRLVAISPPRRERVAEMLEGAPTDVASELLDRIRGALAGS